MKTALIVIAAIVGVLIFALLFDKLSGWFFGLFKKKEHTVEDFRKQVDKINKR